MDDLSRCCTGKATLLFNEWLFELDILRHSSNSLRCDAILQDRDLPRYTSHR